MPKYANVAYDLGMEHRNIIEELGGHKAVAAALGVRENAVCHWKARGIPPFYWTDITGIAHDLAKVNITADALRAGRTMKQHNSAVSP